MINKPPPQKINRTNAITNRRMIEASKNRRKLFRNHRGKAWQGKSIQVRNKAQLFSFINAVKSKDKINFVVIENPRFCEFGLYAGAGDLIGWEEIIVTPEMIGKKIAIFTSEEIKSLTDRMSKDQKAWDAAVKMAGGNSNIVKEQKDGSVKLI